MEPTISIETELDVSLFDRFALFVLDHPEWNADKVINSAIASFLATQTEDKNNA